MAEWICPKCRGGFPSAALGEEEECPWCGLETDGDFGPPKLERISVQKKEPTVKGDSLFEVIKEKFT